MNESKPNESDGKRSDETTGTEIKQTVTERINERLQNLPVKPDPFACKINQTELDAYEEAKSRFHWTLYYVLFTFDGTITQQQLIDKLITYYRPFWDDDGYTPLIFEGNAFTVNRGQLEFDIVPYLDPDHLDEIDENSARVVAEELVS
jgi:hypothetical protein